MAPTLQCIWYSSMGLMRSVLYVNDLTLGGGTAVDVTALRFNYIVENCEE